MLRFQEGESDGDHVVLLVTEKAGNAYLAHLQAAGVSYLFCGEKTIDLKVALDKVVKHFGLKKLMLEGGGSFNGAMLHAGLVDEISHITIPVVDGGRKVASIFDIPGRRPEDGRRDAEAGEYEKAARRRAVDAIQSRRPPALIASHVDRSPR